MSAIEITRQDLSISQLRAAAARTADAKQAPRILAIAMVLDGLPRWLAARAGGMDRQTPRDWAKPAKGSSWRSQLAEQSLPKRLRRYGWRRVFAPTRMAWPGWRTGPGLGSSHVWPKPSGAKWRSG